MASQNALFPLPNSYLLISSLLLGLVSIVLSYRKKYKWAVGTLVFAGLLIRLFMVYLDPFLHEWDERYHALVAKNMMHHPFVPMLKVANWMQYDMYRWTLTHIWLHKQPLFLWQMALSMKLFGVSEFAIRYPNVLMGSIAILLVYRIGNLVTANKMVAYLAALMVCFSYFDLEMTSGLNGMGTSDMAFQFYVLAGMWAYTEYRNSSTLKYALLIGLFAGCAILVKWLTGFIVFAGWGCIIVYDLVRKDYNRTEIFHFLLALLTCIIVFVPWQLYTFHAFPVEARIEMDYNASHISTAVEGHKGDSDFYLNLFGRYFGGFLFLLLPAGLQLMLLFKQYRNKAVISMIINFVIVFVFFSFIVKTKMDGYFTAVTPLGFIFIGVSLYHILSGKQTYKLLYLPLTIVCMLCCLNIAAITFMHDPRNRNSQYGDDWQNRYDNNLTYKSISKYLPPGVKTLVGVRDNVEVMFYNNGIDAYDQVDGDNLKKLEAMHLPVAYIESFGNLVPADIAAYDSLHVLIVPVK